MTRLAALAAALCLAAVLPARGAATSDPNRPRPATAQREPLAEDEEFRQGYELFQKREFEAASAHLLRFVGTRSKGDDNYEWSLFFLGVSLHEKGLSHASADLLGHLVATRPNAKIVSSSLEILRDLVRTTPFDRDGLVLGVLCDQELGFVDPQNLDFVHYYQGLYDWEHGYAEWGEDHFRKIPRESPYYPRSLYEKALYRIDANDLGAAEELLRQVLKAEPAERTLKNDARITLARIWFEQGRYDLADDAYQDVDIPNVDKAKYLLERAWGQYKNGNPQKAMGLLYAFKAPSFWRHFSPEYFLLKSLLYKDVCHYDRALTVIDEFRGRYGEALRVLYGRGEVQDNPALLLVLREKPEVRRLSDFLNLLAREKAAVEGFGDPELRAYLTRLYDLQIAKTSNRLRGVLKGGYESLAEDLLSYEEQAHLTEYEVGLDMARRASELPAKRAPGPNASKGSWVAYPFQGEFWNDELDDYRVVLENQCDSPEEWDVFFR